MYEWKNNTEWAEEKILLSSSENSGEINYDQIYNRDAHPFSVNVKKNPYLREDFGDFCHSWPSLIFQSEFSISFSSLNPNTFPSFQ